MNLTDLATSTSVTITRDLQKGLVTVAPVDPVDPQWRADMSGFTLADPEETEWLWRALAASSEGLDPRD